MKMSKLDELEVEKQNLSKRIQEIDIEIQGLKLSADNNVFDDLDDAEYEMLEILLEMAAEDCEGSYNCGKDKYTSECYVNGLVYTATLKPEYNRHDKKYYYVDGYKFDLTENQQAILSGVE